MSAQFCEKLHYAISNHYRFAVFKKPDSETINFYIQTSEKNKEEGFVISNFLKDENLSVSPDESFTFELSDLETSGEIASFDLPENYSHKISEAEYVQKIGQCISALNHKLPKVVMSRFSTYPIPLDFFSSWIKIAKAYPKAFVYMSYFPEKMFWFGASPELLIDYHSGDIKTVSLAGTKKLEDSWTEKELEEQQMVTDYIAKVLNSGGFKLSIGETKTIQSGQINHLKTEICSQIDSLEETQKIANLLHPTPAVCGLPKEKAFEYILQNEGYNRGFYTGYVGTKSKDSLNLFVNLRCGELLKNQMKLYAGGGITQKSEPQKEWKETELKINNLLRFF